MTRPSILNEIIALAKKQKGLDQPLVAIFDLDSTLFDVSHRIAKIFHAFAAVPEMQAQYPKECEFLGHMQPHPGDYGVKKTLERAGFVWPSREFAEVLIEYWKNQFFANPFLDFDIPYKGAREYVRDLYNSGAEIRYLSGRDIPRMKEGSIKSLRTHGFPLETDHANLALKPNSDMTDYDFKRDFFLKMDRSSPEVWFFENEPANIHLVVKTTPHIKVVFVDTVHSGTAQLPGAQIPRISGFEV